MTRATIRGADHADPILIRDDTVARLQALSVPGHSFVDAGGMDTITTDLCDCGAVATVKFNLTPSEGGDNWHELCPVHAIEYLDCFVVMGDFVDVEVHLAAPARRLVVVR